MSRRQKWERQDDDWDEYKEADFRRWERECERRERQRECDARQGEAFLAGLLIGWWFLD